MAKARGFSLRIHDDGTIADALRVTKNITPALLTALTKGALRGAERVEKRITEATSTWDHPPRVTTRPAGGFRGAFDKTGAGFQVVTDGPSKDNPYPWVDEGTRGPYLIEAKNAPYLAFQSGFTPKTNPGSLTAGPGGRSGPMVYTKAVVHPGIKPRNITERVVEMTRAEAEKDMEGLVLDAITDAWRE